MEPRRFGAAVHCEKKNARTRLVRAFSFLKGV
jgi:hypothetical protein